MGKKSTERLINVGSNLKMRIEELELKIKTRTESIDSELEKNIEITNELEKKIENANYKNILEITPES